MTPIEILDALSRLPPAERLQVLEAALRMAREEMAQGAAPSSWGTPEQKMAQARERSSGPLNEEDERFGQWLIRKIFRVFTQEN